MTNIEKIRQEVERLKNDYLNRSYTFVPVAMQQLLEFIASLSEEKLSLPDNLDVAAQKVEDYYDVGEEHGYLYCHRGDIKDAFKAGVKWMAEQGYTTETRVDRTPMNGPIGICLHLHDSTGFKIDDKVIVQIRKK